MSLLSRVATAMEAIAPLALADHSWDNVGVLIDCSRNDADGGATVAAATAATTTSETVMLTIDLTEHVLDECVRAGARVVVAYHPCIFAPLKRLTRATAAQRIALTAVRADVSVYCPHTALDAAAGGINDWLARCAAGPHGLLSCTPIVPVSLSTATPAHAQPRSSSSGNDDSNNEAADTCSATGYGRVAQLSQPTTLTALVQTLKRLLRLPTLRVAVPPSWQDERPVQTVAVCAGSGGSVFRRLSSQHGRVDVLLTGEMSHHDVLAALAQEQAVVLCEHSNSERGYLHDILAGELQRRLGAVVRVCVAQSDSDPLVVW